MDRLCGWVSFAWLSCDCLRLGDGWCGWSGFDSCYRVGLWSGGYEDPLTGFMGMVDAVLSDSWVELGLGRGWFGSERSVGYCYYWIIGLTRRGGEFLRVKRGGWV